METVLQKKLPQSNNLYLQLDAKISFLKGHTEEYKVIGMRECTGKDVGTPTWVCVTPSGNEFTVRPEGTREIRREMFKNGSSYIGKMLTVKFQNLTDLGVPRFPVGIAFRDYE